MRTRPVVLAAALAAVAAAALGGSAAPTPAATAALAPAPVWAGTWATNKGPLVVAASGGAVTGTYGYADSSNDPSAHMTGNASGAALAGSWWFDRTDKAPLDKGTYAVTWSWVNGQAQFNGTYTFTGNGTVVTWQGTCTAGACFADTTRPVVKALAAKGAKGSAVVLRYSVADERGYVTETVTVLRGSSVVWRTVVPLHGAAVENAVTAVSWKAPAKAAGAYRFTVTAKDKAGNSASAAAAIVLR